MQKYKKIEDYSYALNDRIGRGYSSEVFRGKNDLTQEAVAIKVIDLHKLQDLNKQLLRS
jgi:serine/threonine-protein kinase ULK/ATG1